MYHKPPEAFIAKGRTRGLARPKRKKKARDSPARSEGEASPYNSSSTTPVQAAQDDLMSLNLGMNEMAVCHIRHLLVAYQAIIPPSRRSPLQRSQHPWWIFLVVIFLDPPVLRLALAWYVVPSSLIIVFGCLTIVFQDDLLGATGNTALTRPIILPPERGDGLEISAVFSKYVERILVRDDADGNAMNVGLLRGRLFSI